MLDTAVYKPFHSLAIFKSKTETQDRIRWLRLGRKWKPGRASQLAGPSGKLVETAGRAKRPRLSLTELLTRGVYGQGGGGRANPASTRAALSAGGFRARGPLPLCALGRLTRRGRLGAGRQRGRLQPRPQPGPRLPGPNRRRRHAVRTRWRKHKKKRDHVCNVEPQTLTFAPLRASVFRCQEKATRVSALLHSLCY